MPSPRDLERGMEYPSRIKIVENGFKATLSAGPYTVRKEGVPDLSFVSGLLYVRADTQKVLTEKIEQLGARILDLREGVVQLPKFDIDQVERIWPIVISSEGLFQTPTLWAYIRPSVEKALAQPKVQPLTLFDVEDLEEFIGLVLAGHSAVDILRDKTTEQWRELELSAWFRGSGRRRYPDDSPLARAQFEAAADRAVHILFGAEAVAAHRGKTVPAS